MTGSRSAPHRHTREDEHSIVLEGQIGFRSGADEVVVGPGGGLHETPEFTELATRYGLPYGDQADSTTSWPVTG